MRLRVPWVPLEFLEHLANLLCFRCYRIEFELVRSFFHEFIQSEGIYFFILAKRGFCTEAYVLSSRTHKINIREGGTGKERIRWMRLLQWDKSNLDGWVTNLHVMVTLKRLPN